MAGSRSENEHEGRRVTRRTEKAKRASSKDQITTLEDKVIRLENATIDAKDRLNVDDVRLWELGEHDDKLKEEFQGIINDVNERVDLQDGSLKDEVKALKKIVEDLAKQAEVAALRKKIDDLKSEVLVYKAAVRNGVVSSPARVLVDVPKPKHFEGTRSAQQVENFLWGLEQYFKASCIIEDADKVSTASIYLTDHDLLWWRRRCSDEKCGGTSVQAWDEFQTEFKNQFYPGDAEREARFKLRHLKQEGSIRDYVREFRELQLQIPDLSEKDALFHFMDGLKPWVCTELDRRDVKELSKAIVVAESLKDHSVDRNKSPKSNPLSTDWRNRDKSNESEREESSNGSGKP
ncbi:hypothetical protein HRI_003772500 [Hibiscus trionum]|uniref:Retrotransposon gag domain-containing protein n=1 Tax=Hibiscus trionum TaxID=183268 RepID=A0A9W7IU58_HIBTR|nr:hypothetical protein HRI_003772500 [Hibiscus trionum]